MKIVGTLLFTLVLSQSASALSVGEITQTLQHPELQELLARGRQIEGLSQGASPKCLGCFGLILETVNTKGVRETFTIHGQDFNGQFDIEIFPN